MILHKTELFITFDTLSETFISHVTFIASGDVAVSTVGAVPEVSRVTLITDSFQVVVDTAMLNLLECTTLQGFIAGNTDQGLCLETLNTVDRNVFVVNGAVPAVIEPEEVVTVIALSCLTKTKGVSTVVTLSNLNVRAILILGLKVVTLRPDTSVIIKSHVSDACSTHIRGMSVINCAVLASTRYRLTLLARGAIGRTTPEVLAHITYGSIIKVDVPTSRDVRIHTLAMFINHSISKTLDTDSAVVA